MPEIFPVPEAWKGKAWIDADGYRRAYDRSLRGPATFWSEQPGRIDCLDRHLPARAKRPGDPVGGRRPRREPHHHLRRAACGGVPPRVEPVIVDDSGKVLEGEATGRLCLRDGGPGMARTVYRDHERFLGTDFSAHPGLYFTGDGARRDADGYFWITGRIDDVINVLGHRLGTAEIESALVAHPTVAEAAVVGYLHELKGQGIHAYVTLKAGEQPGGALRDELADPAVVEALVRERLVAA